jgi:phosphoribosylglycinamide formyltransferase-1
MPSAPREDKRLARLTTLCSAFPEVTRELSGQHATFRVRGKPFAYFLNNHHGDGVVSFCWKADAGENRDWVALDSERYFLPPTLVRADGALSHSSRGPPRSVRRTDTQI